MLPGSRSRWRPDLTTSRSHRGGGVQEAGATSARSAEAAAFEREYPGSSWLASRTLKVLEVVGSRTEALVAKVARRHGISHAALNALAVIEAAEGPMPTGEVGAHMHITTGTTTAVLDTLERDGYVVRLADPDDRRRVLVDITPAAQSILDQVLPEVQQLCAAIMAPIDTDAQEALLETLTALGAALDATPDELPPPAARRPPKRLHRT